MEKELKKMMASVIAVGGIAIITLTSIAVVTGFRNNSLIDNTTANYFITGLTLIGSFMEIIVLSFLGKLIWGMWRAN